MAQKDVYRYQSSMAIKDNTSKPTFKIVNATCVIGQIELEPDGYIFYPRNDVGLSISDLGDIIKLIGLTTSDIVQN